MPVKPLLFFAFLLALSSSYAIEAELPPSETLDTPEMSDEAREYLSWAGELWDGLDQQTGTIEIAEAHATLNVPENFYFLNAADAEKVLVEVWGNPPGREVLGMLFPADLTPFDPESWAVTIQYQEDGYVSDEDAAEIDYNDLLRQMQKDTREASKQRVEQGYESIALVGWAEPPYYDAASHKLHWAKEIKFGDTDENTLNYNIRVLGRKGVLVLNFIAGMEQKPVIDTNLASVLALADFDDGAKYSDFNPGMDKMAAYGLGGLVAGKVLAKTGVLAVALVFLKKFGVFILVGLGGLARTLFGRKKPAE